MAERRSLIDGLNTPKEKALAEAFVFGDKSPSPKMSEERASVTPPPPPRLPLTTRVRYDLFQALKRASLERQLAGQTPNEIQEILELALEPWLRSNGYL